MNEEWRPVEGFEATYRVSNVGNVYSIRSERNIAKQISPYGYVTVSLCWNGVCRSHYVHRLVATAFLGTISKDTEINHKDCDKLNNNSDNLEIVTHAYNMAHAANNGRIPRNYGVRSGRAKFSEKDAIYIKSHKEIIRAAALAKIFGVNCNSVYRIQNGRRWSYLL